MSKQYDEYLDNHISNVLKGYLWMTDNGVLSYDSDLVQQLSQHDMSKRDAEEYDTYDTYFYSCDTANRPDSVEQEFLYAFLHHLHHSVKRNTVLPVGKGGIEVGVQSSRSCICIAFYAWNLY